MPVTRLPNGIGTVPVEHIHKDWQLPYIPQFHTHIEEMDVFVSKTAGSVGTEPWDEKVDANATILTVDGDNGIVRMEILTVPTEAAQIQYAVADVTADAPDMRFSGGFSIPTDPVTTGDFSIGLAENVGDNFFSPTAQGYYFIVEDGVMKFVIVGPSGTTTEADLFTLVPEEFISVQFHRNTADNLFDIGINGLVVKRLELDTIENLPDTDLVCFSAMAVLNSGGGYTVEIDYMWLANTRGYES